VQYIVGLGNNAFENSGRDQVLTTDPCSPPSHQSSTTHYLSSSTNSLDDLARISAKMDCLPLRMRFSARQQTFISRREKSSRNAFYHTTPSDHPLLPREWIRAHGFFLGKGGFHVSGLPDASPYPPEMSMPFHLCAPTVLLGHARMSEKAQHPLRRNSSVGDWECTSIV
jgi:hypothetical protein